MSCLRERFTDAMGLLLDIRARLDAGDVFGARYSLEAELPALMAADAEDLALRRLILGSRPRRKIPAQVRVFVIEREAGVCALCAEPLVPGEEHVDHVVPLFLGGDSGIDNLRATHGLCNLRRTYEAIS